MPVTEESRHRLHQTLDDTIGREDAATLMELLPPPDVATKHDIAQLRSEDITPLRHDLEMHRTQTAAEFALVRKDIDQLEERMDSRFEQVDQRFDALTELITMLGDRMDRLGDRMDRLDGRYENLDNRYEKLVTRIDRQFWQFIGLIVAIAVIVLAVAGAT